MAIKAAQELPSQRTLKMRNILLQCLANRGPVHRQSQRTGDLLTPAVRGPEASSSPRPDNTCSSFCQDTKVSVQLSQQF